MLGGWRRVSSAATRGSQLSCAKAPTPSGTRLCLREQVEKPVSREDASRELQPAICK